MSQPNYSFLLNASFILQKRIGAAQSVHFTRTYDMFILFRKMEYPYYGYGFCGFFRVRA
jgi:hypothetical protein